MPAAGWPAEDTPAESKAAPYANRARQTDPTAPQAPHSPEPRSPSMGGPVRPAPPAGYTKRAPPILVARRASQITTPCSNTTESRSALAVERVFQQPARANGRLLKPRELGRAGGDVRDGKEAQKDQRLGSGIAGHVLFAGRDEYDVARLDRGLAALGYGRSLPRQHIETLLESIVEMRTARRVAGLRRRNLGNAEGDAGADFATHRLERRAPGKPETLRLALLQQSCHQPT